MKQIFITFIMLILPVSFSHGQEFYLNGIADCGLWYKARNEKRSGIFEASIQGFVNGAAMASGVEIWHGNGVNTSPQSAYLYIDNYCKSNPLESIWQASYAFINEKTNNAFNKSQKLLPKK
jgi:hypothetical protein